MEIYKFILTFIFFWGVYYLVLYPRGFWYTTKPALVSAYFGTSFILSYFYYFPQSSMFGFYLVAVSFLILIGFIIEKFFKLSLWIRYLQVKVFELLFQQIAIYYLILIFFEFNYNFWIFGLMFGIIHAPILWFKYLKNLRYVYFFLSFVGGYLFIFLVSNFEYGYYLTYLIHFGFYMLIARSIPYKILKSL